MAETSISNGGIHPRKAACVGSINIDEVYSVPHIVLTGETISSLSFESHPGGKGANQSVAVARAGSEVFHLGSVGNDGNWVLSEMSSAGVDVSNVSINESISTGKAIIQVSEATHDNAIILAPGANHSVSSSKILNILDTKLNKGDFVLFQNEINVDGANEIIEGAVKRGLFVIINPAPCPSNILNTLPNIKLAQVIVVNESEAFSIFQQLESSKMSIQSELDILERFKQGNLKGQGLIDFAKKLGLLILNSFSNSYIVCITLGGDGSVLAIRNQSNSTGVVSTHIIPCLKHVKIVDTTAAGDTYVGYFVAGLMKHADSFLRINQTGELEVYNNTVTSSEPKHEQVLTETLSMELIAVESAKLASVAGGVACETKGALNSIPKFQSVLDRHDHGAFWRLIHQKSIKH